MSRLTRTALSLLSCAACLTACQHTPAAVQLTPMPPPAIDPVLLLPTPGPTRPADGAQQDAVARVLIDYGKALAACNADKAAIAALTRTD